MGITLSSLDGLRACGVLRPGCRVLDIGTSNLYQADADALGAFLAHFGASPDKATIERLGAGSEYGPNGGRNESFVGELLGLAGIRYESFDIVRSYRTTRFDLNTDGVPESLNGAFDVVLNFGTTEHVVNQCNAMKVIHDATAVGGAIVHEVPALGWLDHGYFCYTPRFFLDMARCNGYSLLEFAYRGPMAGAPIYSMAPYHIARFRALAEAIQRQAHLHSYAAENFALYVVMRKNRGGAFRLPLERSTSVAKGLARTAVLKLQRLLSR